MAETVEGKSTSGTYVVQNYPTTKFHTGSKTFSYLSNAGGAARYTYVYTNLPADLTNREVTSAWLEVEMMPGTGSRTLTVQRHAKPKVSYANTTWANRPSTLSGSIAVPVTQNSADTTWIFDVTADLQAIALGGAFYGWRFTTTHASQWRMHGWGSADEVTLHVELDGIPDPPDNLSPDGVTALAAPTFTWLPPINDIIFAQMQVAAVGATWTATGGYSSPAWDSGTVSTTLPVIDSDGLGWTGMAEDALVEVSVRQTTSGGTSDWCDPVTVTRKSLPTLTIDSPTGTTEDPTPTITWTASEQDRYEVTLLSGGKTLYYSKPQPGDDAAHQTTKGATVAGQLLTARVRVYDAEDRSPSPGDPGYTEATEVFTYTPGVAPAVSTLVAVQDGVSPWVDLAWVRDDVPDEWLVMRDDVLVARFDGLDEDSDPVTSWRDWGCPPNTDVVYNVVPVVEGAAGLDGPSAAIRTIVTGAWVVDPDTGRHFRITGTPGLAYTESSVTYELTGAEYPVTRTFALQGLSGPESGVLQDFDGRTVAEQEADLFAIKASPDSTYRYVAGDLNIPAYISNLTTLIDPALSFKSAYPDPVRIFKQVSFQVTQNGELPFPAVSL